MILRRALRHGYLLGLDLPFLSPVTLECEVTEWNEKQEYLRGKIVAQQADESVLTDGKIDLGKLQPIMYDASFHVYRVIGDVVGNAFKDGLEIKNK